MVDIKRKKYYFIGICYFKKGFGFLDLIKTYILSY